MIAYLRGIARDIGEDTIVVDVQGVGYLIQCSGRTLSKVPGNGEPVELLIKTQVREDDISLFGFADAHERSWFSLLQSIHGVGARLALAILSTLRPDELLTIVAAQDRKSLTRVSGVGPRLATRIMSELENQQAKISDLHDSDSVIGDQTDGEKQRENAVSALVNLGYGRSDAFLAVKATMDRAAGELTFDQLLRDALREIAG
ncbi:MAG: Holliday junction branch migration protein RuvA [Pseudomonadota bacterium]